MINLILFYIAIAFVFFVITASVTAKQSQARRKHHVLCTIICIGISIIWPVVMFVQVMDWVYVYIYDYTVGKE